MKWPNLKWPRPQWLHRHQPAGAAPSRVRSRDQLREAVASIACRPVRSLLTITGTVLGCAAFVAILGLTDTARGQITSRFNELEATTVTVVDANAQANQADRTIYSFPDDVGARLRPLNGVVDAGVYFSLYVARPALTPGQSGDRATIANRPQSDGLGSATGASLTVWGTEGGALAAAGASLASGVWFDDFHLLTDQPVAVLGPAAAASLGVATVRTNPTVFVGDDSYTVIGLLADCGALPELGNAVMLPAPLARQRYGNPTNPAHALIRTDLGAARLIARQAPYALDQSHPENLSAVPPPDWSMVTDDVNASLNGLLLGLAAVALIIGCVAIANTTLVAVMERAGEIGLRQALGAKPVHIMVQFLTESVILGLLGGVLGSAVGVAAVIVGAVARQWTPVLDPWLLLLAPAAGLVVGALAGLYPAWRASRLPPATALQRL
ncbi:MAG: ABC transporter permease [Propionibacteriaceae bacterium]|jgi:putative ABC transport system permease protein|nr:ABC transporter permease [Propionibacteriaceae bacterium]